MANLPIDEIEKMVGSRYALTVLAGKRARELRDGAPRLVNTDSNNPIMIALQEIYEGKVVPENLDYAAMEGIAPAEESLSTEGVDLGDLTDADAAGVELPGAVDITGEPIGDSVPEVASDRLDLMLELGPETAAAILSGTQPIGEEAGPNEADENADEAAEASGTAGTDEAAATEEAAAGEDVEG